MLQNEKPVAASIKIVPRANPLKPAGTAAASRELDKSKALVSPVQKELEKMKRRADARGKEADTLRRRVQELEPEVRRLEKELEKQRGARRAVASSRSPSMARDEGHTDSSTRTITDEDNAALRSYVEAAEKKASIMQLGCNQLETDHSLARPGSVGVENTGNRDIIRRESKDEQYATAREELDIRRTKKQLEVAERRLRNSLFVNQAHENLVVEATAREQAAHARAVELERRLQRALEKLESNERRDMMTGLRASLTRNEQAIHLAEGEIRALQLDPELFLPISTAKRRQLMHSEQRLHRLKRRNKSHSAALVQAETVEQMHDGLRAAASCDDSEAAKKLLGSGISVNVPDEAGLSAFLYACGQANVEMVQLMLDAGGDVLDGDGSITGLAIAAGKVRIGCTIFLQNNCKRKRGESSTRARS